MYYPIHPTYTMSLQDIRVHPFLGLNKESPELTRESTTLYNRIHKLETAQINQIYYIHTIELST